MDVCVVRVSTVSFQYNLGGLREVHTHANYVFAHVQGEKYLFLLERQEQNVRSKAILMNRVVYRVAAVTRRSGWSPGRP